MSLINLLTVGATLDGAKDRSGGYKLDSIGALPTFGAPKTTSPSPPVAPAQEAPGAGNADAEAISSAKETPISEVAPQPQGSLFTLPDAAAPPPMQSGNLVSQQVPEKKDTQLQAGRSPYFPGVGSEGTTGLPAINLTAEPLENKMLLNHRVTAAADADPVAQTSESAVSPVSKPAPRATSHAQPIWKSAIQQVWKPALRPESRQSGRAVPALSAAPDEPAASSPSGQPTAPKGQTESWIKRMARHLLFGRPVANSSAATVQIELALEKITVVRNDLLDENSAGRGGPSERSAPWFNLAARFSKKPSVNAPPTAESLGSAEPPMNPGSATPARQEPRPTEAQIEQPVTAVGRGSRRAAPGSTGHFTESLPVQPAPEAQPVLTTRA